jgi:hypothetical protein
MVSYGAFMFPSLVGRRIGFGLGVASENKPVDVAPARAGGILMDSP